MPHKNKNKSYLGHNTLQRQYYNPCFKQTKRRSKNPRRNHFSVAFIPQSAWIMLRSYDGTARHGCHRHNAIRKWLNAAVMTSSSQSCSMSICLCCARTTAASTGAQFPRISGYVISSFSSLTLQWMGKGARAVYEHTSKSMNKEVCRMIYSDILWQIIHWTHCSFSI